MMVVMSIENSSIYTHSLISLQSIPRKYNHLLKLNSVGYYKKKGYSLKNFHANFCHISFILSGRGNYTYKGVHYEVNAPYVLTQFPGYHYFYGPDTAWEELYITYPSTYQKMLTDSGYYDQDRPCWPVQREGEFYQIVSRLRALLEDPYEDYRADQIDLTTLELLGISQRKQLAVKTNSSEERVMQIHQEVSENFMRPLNFQLLAKQRSLSYPYFRKIWAAKYKLSPTHYLNDLRITQATELLKSSAASIRELAFMLQYDDPFYFSKCFKKKYGMSPRAYREKMRT